MKKETLYGMLAGFLGFFILDIVGIHNIFIKMVILIVVISVIMIYFEKKRRKKENRDDDYEKEKK